MFIRQNETESIIIADEAMHGNDGRIICKCEAYTIGNSNGWTAVEHRNYAIKFIESN